MVDSYFFPQEDWEVQEFDERFWPLHGLDRQSPDFEHEIEFGFLDLAIPEDWEIRFLLRPQQNFDGDELSWRELARMIGYEFPEAIDDDPFDIGYKFGDLNYQWSISTRAPLLPSVVIRLREVLEPFTSEIAYFDPYMQASWVAPKWGMCEIGTCTWEEMENDILPRPPLSFWDVEKRWCIWTRYECSTSRIAGIPAVMDRIRNHSAIETLAYSSSGTTLESALLRLSSVEPLPPSGGPHLHGGESANRGLL